MNAPKREPRREDFRQFMPMTVRWGDMDAIGHVNNVQYFRYGESGRIAYFDALQEEDPTFWKEHGIILASMGCDFLAQVHYPAELEIGTRISRLGRSSLEMTQAIFQGDKLVAQLKGVMVWFDYRAQKTLPIPEHVRAWIRRRETVAPEE
ncbi:MAG TPA: thioesterase family protein [Nevskia sp.]|nr:thioesterase family protein [Nevskia sp.]